MIDALTMSAPSVMVHTTEGRGFSPEEVAQRCADRIVHISDSAPDPIRSQAQAFKGQVAGTVARYIREAIASDRTTVYNALNDAGHPDLAALIRRV